MEIIIKTQVIRENSIDYTLEHPDKVFRYWNEEIATNPSFDQEKEHLYVLMLDSKLYIKAHNLVTMGLINQTLMHAREIFKPAIVMSACHIILAHNHPSGDPSPSSDDIQSTRQIIKAGQVLGIPLLDHVVIGKQTEKHPSGYVSLKQLGILHCD